MRPSFGQRADLALRHRIPLIVSIALLLVAVVPTHVPGLVRIGPMMTTIAVFYWATRRPDLFGYGSVFLLGLFEDLITYTPLGVGTFTLLLLYGGVVAQYKFFYGKSFGVTWWAFTMVAAAISLIKWLCVSLVEGGMVDATAPLHGYLMTAALYPLVAWLLARIQIQFLSEA